MNFESMLQPLAADAFLTQYFGRTLLHVPGESSKFADLLSWNAVNDLLRYHRLDAKQLRLVKDGKTIPLESYSRQGKTPDRARMPQVSAPKITELLKEGATLIINSVDEMYAPVTALTEHCEARLQTRAGANLYAAWRRSRGFDLHWDDHDVFILQIAGNKFWQVYGQTLPYPMRRSEVKRPEGDPLWQALLNPGDLLYIPRGWWHVATPLDEPALHITLGVYNPTGLSILEWLSEGLSVHECLRMDIPRFAAPHAQAHYIDRIREAITASLMNPEVLQAFLRHWNIASVPRPSFGLPWSATAQTIPDSEECTIALSSSRMDVRPGPDAETAEVSFDAKTVGLASELEPLLRAIMRRSEPVSMQELRNQLAPSEDPAVFREHLADLVRLGIIVVNQPRG